ncbi:MAG: type II toxin-antitoxin system Phd/YefM family antitoxin [Candidatus Aminicenantes bacterium]|nr:type II toxin-antitoxin system Phd/YefM family antitoxin [Candidatus Aminicenantes bacterium]
MTNVTAGELKKRGVSIIDDIIAEQGEAIITVRGKKKYVVLDMNTYNRYREYELEAALIETKRDLAAGDFVEESVDDHIERIRDEL